MTYDPQNIFARILRGEIPCQKIYEDDFALAFYDVNPKTKIHALVIPKAPYTSSFDFYSQAPSDMVIGFSRAISKTVNELGLTQDPGFRLLMNTGPDAGQEVPHFHIHILGGQSIGPMVCPHHGS